MRFLTINFFIRIILVALYYKYLMPKVNHIYKGQHQKLVNICIAILIYLFFPVKLVFLIFLIYLIIYLYGYYKEEH